MWPSPRRRPPSGAMPESEEAAEPQGRLRADALPHTLAFHKGVTDNPDLSLVFSCRFASVSACRI